MNNNWILIGKYLDKPVYFSSIKILRETLTDDFSSSVFLLCFENDETGSLQINNFFDALLKTVPLAVRFVGKHSNEYFTLALNNESLHKSYRHTMTYITKKSAIREWIYDLFYATWPSEERHDEWKDYRIIIFSNEILCERLRKEIIKFLK